MSRSILTVFLFCLFFSIIGLSLNEARGDRLSDTMRSISEKPYIGSEIRKEKENQEFQRGILGIVSVTVLVCIFLVAISRIVKKQSREAVKEEIAQSEKITASTPPVTNPATYFRTKCPGCSRALRIEEKAYGKKLPCPGCGKVLKVGRPHATPPSMFPAHSG